MPHLETARTGDAVALDRAGLRAARVVGRRLEVYDLRGPLP